MRLQLKALTPIGHCQPKAVAPKRECAKADGSPSLAG
jgi:hypothetical protein